MELTQEVLNLTKIGETVSGKICEGCDVTTKIIESYHSYFEKQKR